MRKETRYVSEDGREFRNEDDCKMWEARLSSAAAVDLWLNERYKGKANSERMKTLLRNAVVEWEGVRQSFIDSIEDKLEDKAA